MLHLKQLSDISDYGLTAEHVMQTEQLLKLAELYAEESYILLWQRGKGQVLLQTAATPTDTLRALWQVSHCH